MFQPWILAGERSSLWTRIATTESVLLCVRMQSQPLLWNSNRRLALAANCLDKRAGFFSNSTAPNGSESGGGLFPAAVLRLPGPAISKSNSAGKRKERKNHEFTYPIQNDNSPTSHRTGAHRRRRVDSRAGPRNAFMRRGNGVHCWQRKSWRALCKWPAQLDVQRA